ncbi:MAG: hypothetical protein WCY37_05740 [Candidatus Dojkabacteria bacterium]|jgi:hypothetical protein
MKDCKSVRLFRWSGYPFTAYGKRGRAWTLIEWEWGDAWVRIPLDKVAKNPDVAMSVAVSKVLRLRPSKNTTRQDYVHRR